MKSIHLTIPTMRCGGCVNKITAVLQGVSRVESVTANLAEQRVKVVGEVEAEVLYQALERAGYPADQDLCFAD